MLKKGLVQLPVLAYPTRDGQFVLCTDASNMGMGAVLEQEQEEDGRVAKRMIPYASITLNASQRRYCTTNKEFMAVVTTVKLFKYYLTDSHFTVVTCHASFTWLCNFKEPEGVITRWITQLQAFDFDIVHRPGKRHNHADRLCRRTSHPCKRDTCPECATLLNQVIPEDELVRALAPCDQYMEDFGNYIEPVEHDSALFRDLTAPVPSPSAQAIPPDLLWYLGHHPDKDDGPTSGRSPPDQRPFGPKKTGPH